KPRSILIAGLPQKYGSSLDFLLLSSEIGVSAEVVDDRPEAIEKLHTSLAAGGGVSSIRKPARASAVSDLTTLNFPDGAFDLVICSEVLQRLPQKQAYITELARVGKRVALFCPNQDNGAHTEISGLSGVRLDELRGFVRGLGRDFSSGYIDMPPFPPGITRSEDQRDQATSGKMEAFAMWSLGYYARLEHFLPNAIRKKKSHIVYALIDRMTNESAA
ncbi:MAG: methyltransferase domain-containing protein, partial [Methylococcales bacterium]|nr:methyltransferase domain-containing protein [Methylococcales bacterium]